MSDQDAKQDTHARVRRVIRVHCPRNAAHKLGQVRQVASPPGSLLPIVLVVDVVPRREAGLCSSLRRDGDRLRGACPRCFGSDYVVRWATVVHALAVMNQREARIPMTAEAFARLSLPVFEAPLLPDLPYDPYEPWEEESDPPLPE